MKVLRKPLPNLIACATRHGIQVGTFILFHGLRPARSLAIDGNELVPTRPERHDPAGKSGAKQDQVDPTGEGAQPVFTGDAVVEIGEAPQEGKMALAPGNGAVEVVAGGNRGAVHGQHNLLERIQNPPRLTAVVEIGKLLL